MQQCDRELWFEYQKVKQQVDAYPDGKQRDKWLEVAKRQRNLLVESNMGLVGMVLQKHGHNFRGVAEEDLKQAGFMGLISAVEQFNPNQGVAFSTYSVRFIHGRMKQYMRDKARTIRINQSVQEQVWAYRKATERAKKEHGDRLTWPLIQLYLPQSMQNIAQERWMEIMQDADKTECYSYDKLMDSAEGLDMMSMLGEEDQPPVKPKRYKNSVFKKDKRIGQAIASLKQMSMF